MVANDGFQNAVIPQRRLWFGLAASALAWVSLGGIDILITWRTCADGQPFGATALHPIARPLYIGAAVILFSIVLVAGRTSYRNWRALAGECGLIETLATDRQEFMAILGVFVSFTLGIGIIWLTVPLFLVQFCMRAK
jgi:hypothetical protein